VIHVAGTNGKGSTVAYLRAMAEAAGLKVHVFTSPHLVRFAERIRLAGTLITDEHLAEVLERVEAANAGLPITFFEITTAAAFQAFSEVPADLCLVEVGLGGILDATNVVMPALSVIAPIDIDHREFLGDTLAAIAQEKAGIIKPNTPVVSARQQEEAERVVEREADLFEAPLTLMGRDFDAWNERGGCWCRCRTACWTCPPRPAGRAPVRQRRPGGGGPADPERSAHRRGGHGQGDRGHDLARAVPAPDRRAAGRHAPRRRAPTSGWTAGTIPMPAGRGPGAGRAGGPRRTAGGPDLGPAGQQGRHRLLRAVRAAGRQGLQVTFEGHAAASAAQTAAAAELAGLRAHACDTSRRPWKRRWRSSPRRTC
jgi:dihydrofolate synthase/folylpolyglutamate synthase